MLFFFQGEVGIRDSSVTGVQTCAFFFQAEDGIRDSSVTGVQTCALPISMKSMADRFAEEGYVVLVPDLFWRFKPGISLGYGEADMKQALDYLGRFDVDLAVDDIAATVATLRSEERRVGEECRSRLSPYH